MKLSPAIRNYLSDQQVNFNLLEHSRSSTSMQTAHKSHIAPSQLAKAVVLRDRDDYIVCVIPTSHQLVINWLNGDYKRHYSLANEDEISELFPDCEVGAIPVFGQAYGLSVVWDNHLRHAAQVYVEAGDHRHIIQLDQAEFQQLMTGSDHMTLSCTPETMEFYRHVH